MARAKKTSARTRSEAAIHALARVVDGAVERLERRYEVMSDRLDALDVSAEARVGPTNEWTVRHQYGAENPLGGRPGARVPSGDASLPAPEFTRYGQDEPEAARCRGGLPRDVMAVAMPAKDTAPEKPVPGVGYMDAAHVEEMNRLLTETQPWFEPGRGVDQDRRVLIEPGTIERMNKALNGKFTVYEPEAMDHPVLLVLSEVVALRKRLDQNERLIRFLVERSASPR